MRLMIVFSVILVAAVCAADVYAQTKKWKKPKALRFYRLQIARQKDPAKFEKNLLTAIENTDGTLRIFFSVLLAEQYERSGDFVAAERFYTDAYTEAKGTRVSIVKSYFPDISGTIYDSYDRLGYFYLRTGNLRKAEQIFQESQAARNSRYPARSVHRIHPLVGMGSLYFRRGDYDKTYELFNKAIGMLNRAMTTGYDYDNVNRLFLSDLAELCMALGRSKEAIRYIDQLSLASSGFAKFGSPLRRKLETARIFELKARYSLLTGDFDKAREYLRLANKYYPPRIGASDVKFKLLKTEALLYWYQNNVAEASKTFQRLVQNHREHIARNFVSMSEYEKEQFFNTLKSDLSLFNAYVLDIHDTDPTALYEDIYNNTINTKALLLNTTNRQKNRIMASGDQVLIGKLHQWERAKSLLATQFYSKQTIGVDSLERKVEMLEKDINQHTSLFQQKENAVDWKQVRSTLKTGEAAIEILRLNTIDKRTRNGYSRSGGLSDSVVYAVLILKPDLPEPQLFYLPNGNRMEKRSLPFYRNSIYARLEDRSSYNEFWLPIQEHLANIKRVFISPDGVYNQINLNTLFNPLTGKYVIDEMELVYLTNTSDMLRKKSDVGMREAVLIGRPAYKLDQVPVLAERATPEYGLRNILTEDLMNFRQQDFVDLPGTESEVTRIEETLKARNMSVVTYTGAEASEENVKMLSSPAILHIATHGFFVEDAASVVNPMIRSGVVLAGVENAERKGAEDGILTAYEATNLDLESTNLVVLSACQTGLGEVRNGEGVYGLQRAIIVAGAGNLLMSLWKVDDEATSQMMSGFYQAWDGTDNLRAFRETQLALRSKYRHPFYWGAFIMLGN
jgi:CHAT domain-containing protein